MPLKSLRDGALGLAAMNFIPDRDLVVRELPTVFNVSGRFVPSIAAEALRVAQDASTFIIRSSSASGETEFGQQKAASSENQVGALESPSQVDQAPFAFGTPEPVLNGRFGFANPVGEFQTRDGCGENCFDRGHGERTLRHTRHASGERSTRRAYSR